MRYIILILSAAVIAAVFYLVSISGGEEQNKEDIEFIEAVSSRAVSANIMLINATETASYISYSGGQSGAIILKKSDRYYALTALHGIPAGPESYNTKIIVLGYDQPAYTEADEYTGLNEFYAQFPVADIEYYDDAYDLAVISFQSDNDYLELPIASGPPGYNEPVAVIGNPGQGERNTVVVGRITNKKPVLFRDKASGAQYNIIQNSAKTSGGFSGGAVLNRNLELVGIHLGALVNIFHQFRTSCAMPSDSILVFLAAWEKS